MKGYARQNVAWKSLSQQVGTGKLFTLGEIDGQETKCRGKRNGSFPRQIVFFRAGN